VQVEGRKKSAVKKKKSIRLEEGTDLRQIKKGEEEDQTKKRNSGKHFAIWHLKSLRVASEYRHHRGDEFGSSSGVTAKED